MRRSPTVLLAAVLVGASFAVTVPLADAAKKRTYVYAHDSDDNGQVFGYELGRDGTLTALPTSPFTSDELSTGCGGQCQTMAYSKKRRVLLTTNDAGVTSWLVAKDGSLTEVAGSPFSAPDAIGIAVVEIKKRAFAYVARNAGALTGFEIHADGTLTTLPGTPFVVGDDLVGAAAVKQTLLIMSERGGSIHSYAVGKDGRLTEAEASPVDLSEDDSAYSVHTDAKGKFAINGGGLGLYTARMNKKTAAIDTTSVETLELTVTPSNGPAVSGKGLIAVIPFGRSPSLDDVQIVKLNKKTGALSTLGDAQTLGMPQVSVYVWDLKGKHVIAASRENDEVRAFAVNKKTGAVVQTDQAGMPGAADVTDMEVIQR